MAGPSGGGPKSPGAGLLPSNVTLGGNCPPRFPEIQYASVALVTLGGSKESVIGLLDLPGVLSCLLAGPSWSHSLGKLMSSPQVSWPNTWLYLHVGRITVRDKGMSARV